MRSCLLCLMTFAVAFAAADTIEAEGNDTTEYKAITINLNNFQDVIGKKIWKIWFNLSTKEQKCIQKVLENSTNSYLSGDDKLVDVKAVQKACPASAVQFKQLYQRIVKRVKTKFGQLTKSFPENVMHALQNIWIDFESKRTAGDLRTPTDQAKLLEAMAVDLEQLSATDREAVANTYPQMINLLSGKREGGDDIVHIEAIAEAGWSNAMQVLRDHAQQLTGQSVDTNTVRLRLQKLLDDLKGAFSVLF